MGDFNAERGEGWHKSLAKNGLVDVLETFSKVTANYPYSYNSGKSSKWIDFVLTQDIDVAKQVTEINVGVGDSCQFNHESLPNEEIPSDHLPIRMRLKLL